MSFKQALCACLALAALLGITACNLQTHDKALEHDTARYNTGKYSCLSKMGAEVNKYLNGEYNQSQVMMFVGCVRSALTAFEFHVRGKDLDRYAPLEVAKFLNDSFLGDSKLTPPLVKEIMTIKTLMIGGGEDYISREEFSALIKFLDVIQEEAVNNLPYVKLYKIKIESTILERVDPILLRAAKAQLAQSAKRLADHLSQSGVTYSFDSFERLLNESRIFLKWNDYNPDLKNASDVRELLSRFKETTVGDNRQQIKSTEWQPFLAAVAGVYGAYLDFEYLVRKQNMLYGAGLENFISLSEYVIGLFQNAINQQEKKVITFATIFCLIDALDKMKLLPMNIRGESLKPALKYTIQNVLKDPVSNIDADAVPGLNLPGLSEARKEFYNWAESQRFMNSVAEEKLRGMGIMDNSDHTPFFISLLKNLDFRKLFDGAHTEYNDNNIEYLAKYVTPLFKVGDNRVWVVPPNEQDLFDVRHGLHDMGRLNVIRAVVRQLLRGFASPDRVLLMATSPQTTGVTDQEMEKFYQTARSLGEDLLFMDPRKDKVGLRIFKEGNIFTYTGNGIQEPDAFNQHLLNFTETIEVISLMWSGGQVRDALHERISPICQKETGKTPEIDILGKVKIDRACFFKHLSDDGFSDFSNLPYMQKFIGELRPTDLATFYERLQDLSKIPNLKVDGCYDRDHIELAELATLATVMHYVEVIFSIYDRNQNGHLAAREIMSAFPRFRGYLLQTIREMTGKTQDVSMLKAIFAFLIRERRFPDGFWDKAGIKIDSWGYNNDPDHVDNDLPDMDVDRAGILDVLVMLNSTPTSSDSRDPGATVNFCKAH